MVKDAIADVKETIPDGHRHLVNNDIFAAILYVGGVHRHQSDRPLICCSRMTVAHGAVVSMLQDIVCGTWAIASSCDTMHSHNPDLNIDYARFTHKVYQLRCKCSVPVVSFIV